MRARAVHRVTPLGPGVPVAGTPGGDVLWSAAASRSTLRQPPTCGTSTAGGTGPEMKMSGSSGDQPASGLPIVDKVGELIGIQGRKIAGEHGEKMLTNGHGDIFVAGIAWPSARWSAWRSSRHRSTR
jgi:hypothetical protein